MYISRVHYMNSHSPTTRIRDLKSLLHGSLLEGMNSPWGSFSIAMGFPSLLGGLMMDLSYLRLFGILMFSKQK